MLQECLEVFRQVLQEKGERLITDAYVPKDGTYYIIEIQEHGFQKLLMLDIYYDKKTDVIVNETHEYYSFLCWLDYYSKLLEMNKCMDSTKTIHSCHYLAFAVKKESIQNQKITTEIVKNYYEVLREPYKKYEKKKKSLILYEMVQEKIGEPDIELLDRIEQYMLTQDWNEIDCSKKNYVKFYFVFPDKEKTKEYYKKECERYIIPNLYNNNEFNLKDENVILGLPNNNMGMNAKKPYLENKTRKVSVPHLLNLESALLQNQMFDYFSSQLSKGKNHIYLNNDEEVPELKFYKNIEEPEFLQSGYYLKIKRQKNEVSIEQADVIVDYNPNLQKSFELKDYIGLDEKSWEKQKDNYRSYQKLWEIKALLDKNFFEGKLKYGFDSEIKDLSFSNEIIKQSFLLCREHLADWFWKGIDTQIYEVLEPATFQMIKRSIMENHVFQARHQLNIRWSLLNYLRENRKEGEDMGEIRASLRTHINLPAEEDWIFVNDNEYAYAVGQAVDYLLSLSKAKERQESLINGFLDAKTDKIIREKLIQLYKKYNYAINHVKESRFRKMFEVILEYKPEQINKEMILAGFLGASLIYEKTENKE